MELNKELGLLDVFCIACGAMLSSLFILPGLAYTIAGPAILVSYLLAGFLALTGLLSQAELASAMPKAGGTYFYVTRSMGDAVGTVYGLITWLSLALKVAYELIFMSSLILMVCKINPSLQVPVAIALCGAFFLLNVVGAKEAGKLQLVLVFLICSILIYFCFKAYTSMNVINFQPFAPNELKSILPATGFVFISYGGLLKVASVAEEVKNPGKTIPRAMLLAFVSIILIYMSVIFAAIAVAGGPIESSLLAGSKDPLADAIKLFTTKTGHLLITAAAIMAIISSANSGIMAASRYPFALSRDSMLPEVFGKLNSKFKTPQYSLILTCLVISGVMFANIKTLVKAASAVLILTYIFSCLAVIILRESKIQNYKPQFKSPLYPWVQVFGMIGLIFIMYQTGAKAFMSSLVFVGIGFAVYWYYGRKYTGREYALLHLIERVSDKKLTDHRLESELKDIVHERDEVLKDRFDHLIEECPTIDIEKGITLAEFFRMAAEKMSEDLAIPETEIYNMLMAREMESSTILNNFLAIPHIVVPGVKQFDILLARCKEGIKFNETYPAIHTVFILMGSKDERSFHLQSLAAVCQIVQHESFEKTWLNAKDIKSLRDVILLGQRQRLPEPAKMVIGNK